MEQPQRIRLRLPEQDLHHLTLGSTNPKRMQEWVGSLPMANVGESARQLYQLIQELNRLHADAKTRFALLEAIRQSLVHVERQLGKHYLGQSVVLPEKARKVAGLAQSMLLHLSIGYKLVAIEAIRKLKDKELNRVATVSIHRAISCMGEALLRCYQLYLQLPRHLWLELHQMYLLADGHGIALQEVEDPMFRRVKSSTTKDAYARALLLSTARPNQMRQQEIELVWDATEEWCGFVVINDTRNNSDMFAFDLQADAPPTYRKLASQSTSDQLRTIDAKEISSRLKLAADAPQLPEKGVDFTFPRGFTRELALHLSQAWGNLTERAFARVAASGEVEICVGIGATHYYIAGGIDLDVQLRGSNLKLLHEERDNPFMNRVSRQQEQFDANDAWSQAFDGGAARMGDTVNFSAVRATTEIDQMLADASKQGQPVKPKFDSFACGIVNSSPGGYCLEWVGEMPPQIRTGELLGLREDASRNWSIGVIRWIKQLPGKGAQLGIELLAPKGTPCAARSIKPSGEMSEWMRGLMLPELRAIGQEATLIVPAISFNTGYKVMLNMDGRETKAALYRQLNATAGFRQFLFRYLDVPVAASGSESATGPDDFDSIWSTL